jgi:hypothetical protein
VLNIRGGMIMEVKTCKKCGGTEFYSNGRCKNCSRTRIRNYQRKPRLEAIDAYGAKCACCGEETVEFLALDHINGGGNAERVKLRKEGKNPTTIYKELRKHGWPEGYRVLCHNCNFSLGMYHYCPHKGRPDKEMLEKYSRNERMINNDLS